MIAVCGTRVGGTAQVISATELVMVGDPGAGCLGADVGSNQQQQCEHLDDKIVHNHSSNTFSHSGF